ncbi:MAG: hypothetical protein SVU32_09185, partial [Candidatus Nanohaloarchaea archaeon]|nr:hypothetical protein [Candidatus Nanohaloarchaea archaeon]
WRVYCLTLFPYQQEFQEAMKEASFEDYSEPQTTPYDEAVRGGGEEGDEGDDAEEREFGRREDPAEFR